MGWHHDQRRRPAATSTTAAAAAAPPTAVRAAAVVRACCAVVAAAPAGMAAVPPLFTRNGAMAVSSATCDARAGGGVAAAGSFQVSPQAVTAAAAAAAVAGVVPSCSSSSSSPCRREGREAEGDRKIHRHGRLSLSLHRDSDGGLRKTRHAGGTTITTTTLGGLAFAAPPSRAMLSPSKAARLATGSRRARTRRPRQQDGCPHHSLSSALPLLLLPPHRGLRASIAPPGAGGMAGRRGAGAGGERGGGGYLSPSSSPSSPLGVGITANGPGEGRSLSRRCRSVSGSSGGRRRSSTISSEVSRANNSGSGQDQGHGAGHQGRNYSQAAAAGGRTGRARFSGRPAVAGGGVRSGGAMAHELRPLLDMLDCARGHRATGAAAMKVLDAAAKAGWEKIRFSALRTGKLAAGAAVAGRWKTHGRPLLESMESLGVPARDVCSWTAVLLPLSRLGCADECLEVLDMMEHAVGLDTRAGRHSFGRLDSEGRRQENSDLERKDDLLTVAHNHCMFAFIKAGRHEEAVKHFDAYFRRPQPSQEAVWTRRYKPEGNDRSSSSSGGGGGGTSSSSSSDAFKASAAISAAAAEREGAPLTGGEQGWRGGESVLSPDIFSYTHLMSSLERLGRDRACLSALFEMRARGIKADTYTYVSAMKAVGAAGQWEVAVSLLGELRELEGVAPDVYVYTTAIAACSTAGRWEEALSLEGEMRRNGIKPNAYTVTSCISALARGGEWERAAQELLAAEEAGLPVSTPAYNAALKAFAIGKALQPGLEFFRNMQQEGRVPLDEQTHNIAIELCKECGDTSGAVDILRAMETAGFPPSVVSYNTALGACEVAGDHRLCLQLLREMQHTGGEGKEDDRERDSTRGLRAITANPASRRRRGVSPDLWTYNTALGACARAGEWGAVETLLEEMDADLGGGRVGGDRGGDGVGEVHDGVGGDGDEGTSPSTSRNFITFATLIMAADAGGEPRRCLEHYAEMGRFGLAPNAPVYEAVARACLASRSWRWAMLVHRDAVARQSAVAWTACAAGVAMMAAGRGAHGRKILEGARLDGLLGEDEDDENDDENDDSFDTLNAAAGQAMKAMAQAGDWGGASRLFDTLVDQGTTPSMQLMVMYIRAEAALASSPSSSASTAAAEDSDSAPHGDDSAAPPLASETAITTASTAAAAASIGERRGGLLVSPGHAALLALRRLDGLGLRPGANEHTAALFSCAVDGAKTGGGIAALGVVRSIGEKGLECDARAAAMVLTALSRSKDWGGAAKLADALGACGMSHTDYSATAMISAYGRVGRWEDAVGLVDSLLEERAQASPNVEPGTSAAAATTATTAVFNAGIMACARAGQLEEGMRLLREMWERGVSRDVQTYNTAMALCKATGEWTRAVGLLEAMEADGVAADAVTFNTVIAACEAGADHWTAFSLFNRMEKAGITPDVWTYNSLANVLGSCGEWERAVGLLEDMREQGLKPDVVTYSALISACEKAGQVEASLALLEEMAREGVDANERTFSSAIKSLSSPLFSPPRPLPLHSTSSSSDPISSLAQGSPTKPPSSSSSWRQVARLHEEARRRGKANVVTYSAAISACAKERRWKDALSLLAEMRRDGIEPNDYSFSAAMWACVNAGEGKRALQLFATIMDSQPPTAAAAAAASGSIGTGGGGVGAGNSVESVESLAAAAAAAVAQHNREALLGGEEDGAVGLATGEAGAAADTKPIPKPAAGVARSRDCYMAAITACHKEEDFPRALALLRHMRRKGVRGSLGLYNLVLSMCERYGDAETSKKLLALMRMDKVSPSVVSCNQVIRACEKAGRWEDALAILRAMVSGGISPNVYTVCSALRACCIGDSPERAMALLRELRGIMGTALGLPVFNTLVCLFHRDGLYDLADFFYREAYREGAVTHWQQQEQNSRRLQDPSGSEAEQRAPAASDGEGGQDGSVPGLHASPAVMDLHGHSLPLAHAAVRCALKEVWRSSQRDGTVVGDLTIITGVGRRSLHAFHPVLRPEVQRMLIDEFYPPLDSATEVGNTGRVVVPAKAIEAWLDHNVEAKRPVMARLAAALQPRRPVARLAAALLLQKKAASKAAAAVNGGVAGDAEDSDAGFAGAPPVAHRPQQVGEGGEENKDKDEGESGGRDPEKIPFAVTGGRARSSSSSSASASGRSRSGGSATEGRSASPGSSSSSSSNTNRTGSTSSVSSSATRSSGSSAASATSAFSKRAATTTTTTTTSIGGPSAPSRIVMPPGSSVRAAGTRASPESGRPRKRRVIAVTNAEA
eukprot:g10404.t1